MGVVVPKRMVWSKRPQRWLLAALLGCSAAYVLGCGQQAGQQQDASQAMETQEFAIEGMSCEGCVGTVTSALQAVPGVQSVEVSLQDKKAIVVADGSQVSSQAIEDAVRKAGYKARPITAAGEQPPASDK